MATARRDTAAAEGRGPRAAVVAGILLLVTPGAAQEEGENATPSSRGEPILLDQVAAVVGDAVILRSTLEESLPLFLQLEQQELGRELTPRERQAVQVKVLEQLVNRHCLAQAAKTLGILEPAQVEEWFRMRMLDLEQEQVRQLGSYNALSRELALQNRTWQSFERMQRLEEMSRLTEELTVHARLRQNHRLLITPKMMRDFYGRHRHLYVYGPQADLAVLAFPVRRSRALPEQKCKEAGAIWRAEDLTGKELSERFSDYCVAQPDELDIRAGDTRPLQAFLVDFALQNPAGTVSEPIENEGVFWLLKVLDRREGRDQPFSDAAVQDDIRRRLEGLVVESLRYQAIQRSRNRTHVWKPRLWVR